MAYAPDPHDHTQGIIRLAAAAWDGFGAVNISRHPGQHSVTHSTLAIALPLVHLPGARVEIDGLSQRHTDSRRGTHCIIPTGARMRGAWSCRTDYLILKLEDAFLESLRAQGEALKAPGTVEPKAGIDDPALFQLALLLKEELDNGGARGRLYREALGMAIAAATLAKRHVRPDPVLGITPPRRLRHAVEFINENLHADVSTADVAAAAHLSPRHLNRAFRSAFGLAPHQYVLARRVERAKLLLQDRELSVTEVALRCGFKTASHFTRAFREGAFITPGAYRLSL